jgi:hypothetical protein
MLNAESIQEKRKLKMAQQTHEIGFSFSRNDFSRSACWSARTVSIQARRIAAKLPELRQIQSMKNTEEVSNQT